MMESAAEFLKAFDRLPESDQKEVAFEILKRTAHFDYPSLDEEDLARIADETFQLLDAEEAAKEN
jgi:hypothetical protein